MANRWGKMETVTDFILGGSKITASGDFSHEIKRLLLLERKTMTNLDSILKTRDMTLLTNIRIVHAMVFPSFQVQMWDFYHKEDWGPKNWCFWTMVLEKSLESPLDCVEIKPDNPKGNLHWVFIGKNDKGERMDEIVGWHYWLNGHEFEQTPGDSEGNRSLVCWSPWDQKECGRT